jgi:hypothetical protein
LNAGCGFLCTVHATRGDSLNALVNAALMAGENVTEGIVRKVFVEALDLVVHVDRDDLVRGEGRVRRQVTEITAIVPSLRDGETCEPLFVREGIGRPLAWTGALPPRLEQRIDRMRHEAPRAGSHRTGTAGPSSALCIGVAAPSARLDVPGALPADGGARSVERPAQPASASHPPGSGPAVSARMLAPRAHGVDRSRVRRAGSGDRGACLLGRTSPGGAGCGCARFSPRPDGLRDLAASIGSGRSLTQAVNELAARPLDAQIRPLRARKGARD